MDHWNNVPQDDFLEFKPTYPQTHVPSANTVINPTNNGNPVPSSYVDSDAIQQLKLGFSKMMSTMERLEQRLNRVEQATTQILKNQQETLQVPFMSQSDLDKARQVAEQLEHDTNVAKQLQAAYNKETEVKKSMVGYGGYHQQPTITECPVCGVKVNAMELQVHVEQCLEMFSNDPKKQVQIQETKKKVDQGFFGRMLKFNSTSTKTETKVTTQHQATASPSDMNESVTSPPYSYPNYGYPTLPYQQHGNNGAPQIMMPMYMYPSYPATHMTTQLQE